MDNPPSIPLAVVLLSSPRIFDNIFGWLGAIGLVGIGLAIAGRRLDKAAGKVSPVLSSIWFGIAALSMCAWSVIVVGRSKMLPDETRGRQDGGRNFGTWGSSSGPTPNW